MADTQILSQSEIDALLSSMEAGQEHMADQRPVRPAKPVKPYDFRRPDKFSRAQIRTLQTLYETYGRLLTSSLSGTLRMPVTIKLASIEHGIYDEFLQSLKTPTVLNIISLEPLPGNGLLEIEMTLAFALVERLLGGAGKAWNRNRELTDLELVIIRGIGDTIVKNLRDAWINVMELEPKLEDITQSPQFARVALPTDSVLTIAFEVRLGELTSGMSVCMPYPVLEPVLARLNPQIWISGSRRAALKDSADMVRSNINAVNMPLAVVLGSADISVDELLKLNAGDIVRLGTLANQELDILVGGQPKFRGRPGLSGKRLAIKVTGLHPEQ